MLFIKLQEDCTYPQILSRVDKQIHLKCLHLITGILSRKLSTMIFSSDINVCHGI